MESRFLMTHYFACCILSDFLCILLQVDSSQMNFLHPTPFKMTIGSFNRSQFCSKSTLNKHKSEKGSLFEALNIWMQYQLPEETKLLLFLTKMGTFSTSELQCTCIKMIARMCRSKTCLGGQIFYLSCWLWHRKIPSRVRNDKNCDSIGNGWIFFCNS